MRWTNKNYGLRQGANRTVRTFLWWPTKIRGETRWLEMANRRQTVRIDYGHWLGRTYWVNNAWVNL